MQSPKKALICNLNHVHLQHVSLGLHLSRHPELQDDVASLGTPRERVGCRECQECNANAGQELVDANSNNPSLLCRCCDAHLLSSELKQGLQIQPSLANCPAVSHDDDEEEEEEEDIGSPSDPTSSSISSCSDLSLEESPVSVYCKVFPGVRTQSPEGQPNIVPLEEAQNVLSLAGQSETVPNLHADSEKSPELSAWDSPDSLGESSLTESPSDPVTPCSHSRVGPPQTGSNQAPPFVPLPLRPCRAPPARPEVPPLRPGLDANCNAVPVCKANMDRLSVERVDVNSNRPPLLEVRFGSEPPPVPPRTKRGLQGLRRREGEKPASGSVLPTPVKNPFHQSDPPSEASKKSITSFHELAQKRKKVPVGPPVPPNKKDQSDWLIVFSPDSEFPPYHELPWEERQEATGSLPSSGEPPNPLGGPQGGVVTFQQHSQLAANVRCRIIPGQGVPDSHARQERGELEPTPSGHLRGPKEMPPRRKTPRPGLQPIAEGGSDDGEDRGAPWLPSARNSGSPPKARRDPHVPGKEDQGVRGFTEAGSWTPSSTSPWPQPLPSQPPLLHFSLAGTPAAEASPLSVGPGLPSPDPPGLAFCPRLKTLSCEEVCLLASRPGPLFDAFSPSGLLPVRLSPIGAYSPPARTLLPFLESPDLAVLFSPLFPRSKTFPALAFPTYQVPERPFGARRPLGSPSGGGPLGRVSGDTMNATESAQQLRHSQSFGGIASKRCPWRAEMDEVSAQLRKQKKALLIAVSVSVDKIVTHFSTARNLVQKAQLGDSRLTPEVGYLVLSTLCPALHALVGDGLKPFQKDIITGQRPSSPWSVIEASARPGPHTRSLDTLYWRVSRLAPLCSNHQRFHAFILGLLNLKQAEEWFFHLQRNSELVSALYLPTAFLALSQRFCRCWTEELLLLLQPLAVLPFQLDLLFEHHHLPLSIRPMPRPSAPAPEVLDGWWKGAGLTQLDLEEDGSTAQPGPPPDSQAEVPLCRRLFHWGDQFAHTLLGPAQAGQPESEATPHSWWKQVDWVPGLHTSSSESQGTAAKSEGPPVAPGPGRSGSGRQTVRLVGDVPGAARQPGAAPLRTSKTPEEENPGTGDSLGSGNGSWFGWLFGANYPVAPSETDPTLPGSRRPSRWLPPSVSALDLIRKVVAMEKCPPEAPSGEDPADLSPTSRAVRALCDHTAGETGQLSFCKGDILQVVETVDEDWIICCSRDGQGLVPVGYTSLIL